MISVIIPCFNQGLYLEEAVDSVLAQTYQNFEIIIVDDGSTDEYTKSLLNNFLRPKTIVFRTANKGVSAARNFGISKSTGDFILPLDADDVIGNEFLEKVLKYADKYDIIYTATKCFGDEKNELALSYFSIEKQLKQNLIVNTALYSKRMWQQVDGYDEKMRNGWEDWDFWLKLIEHNATVFRINEKLFFYRIISNSRNRSFSHIERLSLEQQLIANHIDLYRKYFPEPLTILRELDALRMEKAEFEKYKQQIYNSASYKLGNFLLKPFKWINKLCNNY